MASNGIKLDRTNQDKLTKTINYEKKINSPFHTCCHWR